MPTTANWKLYLKCSLAGLLRIILMSHTWWADASRSWLWALLAESDRPSRAAVATRTHDLSLCLKGMFWNIAFFKAKKIAVSLKKNKTQKTPSKQNTVYFAL